MLPVNCWLAVEAIESDDPVVVEEGLGIGADIKTVRYGIVNDVDFDGQR